MCLGRCALAEDKQRGKKRNRLFSRSDNFHIYIIRFEQSGFSQCQSSWQLTNSISAAGVNCQLRFRIDFFLILFYFILCYDSLVYSLLQRVTVHSQFRNDKMLMTAENKRI